MYYFYIYQALSQYVFLHVFLSVIMFLWLYFVSLYCIVGLVILFCVYFIISYFVFQLQCIVINLTRLVYRDARV